MGLCVCVWLDVWSSTAVQKTAFVVVWACAMCYRGETDGVQIRQLGLGVVMHLDVCVCEGVCVCVLGGR